MKLRLIIVAAVLFCIGGLPALFIATAFYVPTLFVIRSDYPTHAKCFMAGGILFFMMNIMAGLAILLAYITDFIKG